MFKETANLHDTGSYFENDSNIFKNNKVKTALSDHI